MSAQIEQYKQQAAEHALAEVRSGMHVGLGTGSTARYVLEGLAARLRDGRLQHVVGVPTSEATAAKARELGIPLTSLDAQPTLDLAIDGADEIDPRLNLIKGLGGALLREKIIAWASQRFIVVADSSKLVAVLGEHAPLPVEVLMFGLRPVERQLRALGCEPALRRLSDSTPFQTDQGNVILDCRFPTIAEPGTIGAAIHAIPGVVEHGLFIGMAAAAYVAGPQGVTEIRSG